MKIPRRLRPLLVLFLCTLSSCATVVESTQSYPPVVAQTGYDHLFPYYIELCAVSQIRSNFTTHGGSPGHAAMYIKGACVDPATDYPTLKRCGTEVDLADPDSGTGVSVNKVLRNVNWLAIPSKQLFYYGNLEPDETLNVDTAIRAIKDAERAGAFSGVEAHSSFLPPEDDEDARYFVLAAETLGTDFALSFGRAAYCARVPMEARELEEVIGYLNGLNTEYATGQQDYQWSGYNDNCAHALHNSLAAAGVWKEKSVRSIKLRQLFNLSVPANEFVDLALLSMTYDISDFDKVYRNPVLRQSLLDRQWLPMRHGALITYIPVHQNNELYDTTERIFTLKSPFQRAKAEDIGELYDAPRNTDLETNLQEYRDFYSAILAERPEGWDAPPPDDERESARLAYYRYMEAQLADVEDKWRQLGELRRAGLIQPANR